MKNIKFAEVNIKKNDLKLVNKVLTSGWLAHGKHSEEFEKQICKFTKAKYAVTVSSCTAGLHLSFLAYGLKKGDEVIVPAMTHTATAHAIEYTGARAVFCDIDYKTGNICTSSFKKKITYKTKAVAVVHMAGFAANIDEILSVCKKNIKIIEDCAHALGTTYKNKHVGLFGLAGVFSFYPTKQITTGEGGVLISNNKIFIEKIKKLKAFGIDSPPQMRKNLEFTI